MRRIKTILFLVAIVFAILYFILGKRVTDNSERTDSANQAQKQTPTGARSIRERARDALAARGSDQGPPNRSSDIDLPRSRIDGVVRSGERPVAGALVELRTLRAAEPSVLPVRVKTDVNGRFIFVSLNASMYQVSVMARGFLPYLKEVNYDGENTAILEVNLEKGSISIAQVNGIRVVKESIFYATDRNPTAQNNPVRFYGNDRSVSRNLAYGRCEVSVPDQAHATKAEVMRDARAMGVDALVYVIVQAVENQSKDRFLSELKNESKAGDVLIYVHGFENSFEDAAQVAATLKHDLHFRGPVILYSWPSLDDISVSGYMTDEATVDWSANPHFVDFVNSVLSSGTKRIHFIAHSMGNRLLIHQLEFQGIAPEFARLVFAAPDIDAGKFKNIIQGLNPGMHQLTMYASSRDRALLCSKIAHNYSRAGDTGARLLLSQLDIIDATDVDTGFLHHSYYASSPEVERDIKSILQGDDPPRLHLQPTGAQSWKLSK